jgi:hypothetical protein
VLLPFLPPDVCRSVSLAIEAALLRQLQPNTSLYADAFLSGLPALARSGASHAVYDAIMQDERPSLSLLVACLAHAANADADTKEVIIETTLHGLQSWLQYGSSTNVAEMLYHLAPHLDDEQARRALALATSVRSISPRVQALAVVARALPGDERTLVYERAWQAALRSTNADVRGEALAALIVSMASPAFGQDLPDEQAIGR